MSILGIQPSDFFVLRSPFLAFDELIDWGREDSGFYSDSADRRSAHTWQRRTLALRQRLQSIMSRPEVRIAIYIASPSLFQSIEQWINNPTSKKGRQTERAIVKYFSRMCSRATPFGLFSSYSLGMVGLSSDQHDCALTLSCRDLSRVKNRMDFAFLCNVATWIAGQPAIQSEMRYVSNPSLVDVGEAWHYIEEIEAPGEEEHQLCQIASNEYLTEILRWGTKPRTLHEIRDGLKSKEFTTVFSDDDIREYLAELVSAQVLVPISRPTITGEPALNQLIQSHAGISQAHDIHRDLVRVQTLLSSMNAKGVNVTVSDYHNLASAAERFPIKMDIATLVQVDTQRPLVQRTLSPSILSEAFNTLELLCRMGQTNELSELRIFREAFRARYEEAWVPLSVALDEEVGIGFGSHSGTESSALARDIILSTSKPTADHNLLHSILAANVSRCLESVERELILDPDLFPPLDEASLKLPHSFAVMFSVASDPENSNAGEPLLVWDGAVGPSGVRLLGRFCEGDEELTSKVREHLLDEQSCVPDAIFAEVAFLPRMRLGNVLARPYLRHYEIPYNARTEIAEDRRIDIADLFVSVKTDGRIVLHSRRLDKQIIPRLSTAHGFVNPYLPPIYRFLTALQNQQGCGVPSFNWGALAELPMLPRVRVGRTILSCARWRLSKQELLKLAKVDGWDANRALQALREERGLPRWVRLMEGDTLLTTDLDNELSVDALLHSLRRLDTAVLVEMLPLPEEMWLKGPEGRYHNEIVVPLLRRPKGGQGEHIDSSAPFSATSIYSESRRRIVGSEWLYIRLYASANMIDRLLTSDIRGLCLRIAKKSLISKWFFVRYADPRPHVRLRFAGDPHYLTSVVLPEISLEVQRLIQARTVSDFVLDSYVPELERYGGQFGMLLSEELFCIDSEIVLDVLEMIGADPAQVLRWRVAIVLIDQYLTAFGLTSVAKLSLIKDLRDRHLQAVELGKEQKRRLSERFREERPFLEGALDSKGDSICPGLAQRIKETAGQLSPLVSRFKSYVESGNLSVSVNEFLASHLHMHINRVAKGQTRLHEVIVYDFLTRLYTSCLARQEFTIPDIV